MGNFSISIVIATRNSDRVLATAAERWGPAAECAQIVVQDGGSDDGTVAILEQLRSMRTIDVANSEPDQGPYDAWNKALAHCTGDWILFYGDGDAIPMEWLHALQGMSPGETDIVVGELVLASRRGRSIGSRRHWAPASRQELFDDSLLPHVGMAHSRVLFAERRFDYAYRIAGDREFLLRAWPLRIRNIPEVRQGVMELGGLSNAPHHSKLACSEDLRLKATTACDSRFGAA